MESKKISELEQYTGSADGFMVPGVADGETQKADLGTLVESKATAAGFLKPSGLKTINGEPLAGSGDIDVEMASPFKGWYDTLAALQAAVGSPAVGDYAYIKGATASDPAAIYECATAGTWSDSGRTVDASNVQTFETGQAVNVVAIDGTGLANPASNAIAKATDVVTAIGGGKEMQLNSEFVGKGQTYVSRVVYGLVPGRVYRVRLKSREWDKTGVTSNSSYKLFHIYNTAGGVVTDLVIVATNATPDNYYDITIPETSDYIGIGGRAAVGERVMFGIEDVTDEGVAYTKESDSTKVTIRRVKKASSTESAEGIRIRIVMEVKAGMEVVASTTDPNGLSCGVWSSQNVAFYATANNCLQNISLAWTPAVERTEILTDGWLSISLTAGGAVITDEMKAEMLSKLSFVVGKGTLFDMICTSQSVAMIDRRVVELENVAGKPYVYYGEKVSLNNGYSFVQYATNNQGGQSSACYGDYLFTVANNMARIVCYNLKTKTLLYTLTDFTGSGVVVPSDGTWHCNQSSFSTKRYDENDMFPVLYVSQQNDGGDGTGRCTIVGLRIIPTLVNDEISTFTVSLVQEVKLPVMTDVNCLGNVNIAFDTELGYMWGYGRNNNSQATNYWKAMIVKFAIPELFDGNGDPVTLVELSDADILDSFPEEFSMYNAQGGFVKYGKLFILQGTSQMYLRVIDLYLQKKQVSLVDMTASAGIDFEMEGCWTYNGKVMMAGTGANLYEMEFA